MAIHPLPVAESASPPDAELFDRIRASDQDALDLAMRRHWTPLLRYAGGIAPDGDAAEDATQEAFIRLWQRRAKWSASESLRGLLFRVVRNELLNRRRSRTTRARWLERFARRPARGPHTPAEIFEGHDTAKAAEDALTRLPARRREVFVLVRHVGMTYREAAEVMGVSPQTVANQMSAALKAMREMLAPHIEAEVSRSLPFRRPQRTG